MTLRLGLHFLRGIFLGALSFASLFILFQLLTFNLAGGETLTDIRAQRGTLLVFVILLAVIFVRFTIKWVRNDKRAIGYGLAFVTLAAIIMSAGYFVVLYRYMEFDRNVWLQSELKPFRMAAGLVADDELLGKTVAEIDQMLGEATEQWDYEGVKRSAMTYALTDEWTMLLLFENNVITNIEIKRPSLMT